MLELKFRVWNPKFKEFKYWGFIEDSYIGIPTGSGLSIEYCKKHSEQYTGLKDKNGREIYGGDIVKHKLPNTWHEKGHEIIGVIEYDTESTSFRTCNEYQGQEPIHPDIKLEIIGNIHENQELLK